MWPEREYTVPASCDSGHVMVLTHSQFWTLLKLRRLFSGVGGVMFHYYTPQTLIKELIQFQIFVHGFVQFV